MHGNSPANAPELRRVSLAVLMAQARLAEEKRQGTPRRLHGNRSRLDLGRSFA